MLVNDQYPGPPLIASVGDTVRVTMINESPTGEYVCLCYTILCIQSLLLYTALTSYAHLVYTMVDTMSLHFHGLTMRGQPYADGTCKFLLIFTHLYMHLICTSER